jgi:hypothetical protein
MSEIRVESTTSTSASSTPTSASASAGAPAVPSKPAWPFAVVAWGLLVALVIFEMAC